jgi:hypothetical protein
VTEGGERSYWSVTFQLEPEEYRAYYRLIMKKHRRAAVYGYIILATCGAGVGMLVATLFGGIRVPFLAAGAALGFAAGNHLIRRAECQSVAQTRAAGHFSNQTLTIDEFGFQQEFEDGRRVAYPWTTVKKVGRAPVDFAIVMTQDSALVVPARVFNSDSHAHLFSLMAGAWHANATKNRAPSE